MYKIVGFYNYSNNDVRLFGASNSSNIIKKGEGYEWADGIRLNIADDGLSMNTRILVDLWNGHDASGQPMLAIYCNAQNKLVKGTYNMNQNPFQGIQNITELTDITGDSITGDKRIYLFLSQTSDNAWENHLEAAESCYGLAVLFKSDTQTALISNPVTKNDERQIADDKIPIAMAFAYSRGPMMKKGSRSPLGVRTKLKMETGSHVHIKLYDVANQPKDIEKVVISFKKSDDGAETSPFPKFDDKGKLEFTGAQINSIADTSSLACNTQATKCYGLKKAGEDADEECTHFEITQGGRYEYEITVTLKDGTVFFADPEMDVEAGG